MREHKANLTSFFSGSGECESSKQSEIFRHGIILPSLSHCLTGILAWENPTIALSVKTRQAMRIVLNAQHDTVEQLKEEGALQDTDAALLT